MEITPKIYFNLCRVVWHKTVKKCKKNHQGIDSISIPLFQITTLILFIISQTHNAELWKYGIIKIHKISALILVTLFSSLVMRMDVESMVGEQEYYYPLTGSLGLANVQHSWSHTPRPNIYQISYFHCKCHILVYSQHHKHFIQFNVGSDHNSIYLIIIKCLL